MTVGKISQRDVDVASPDDTVQDAARQMARKRVGTLVVVSEKRPVGLLTDRDLALRMLADARDPRTTTVADVMTAEPATVSEFAPIEEALAKMRTMGVRRLPVTGSDGRLSGIVSIDDFLGLLVKEMNEVGKVLETEAPHGGPPA